jgi:hypothetical protein
MAAHGATQFLLTIQARHFDALMIGYFEDRYPWAALNNSIEEDAMRLMFSRLSYISLRPMGRSNSAQIQGAVRKYSCN